MDCSGSGGSPAFCAALIQSLAAAKDVSG